MHTDNDGNDDENGVWYVTGHHDVVLEKQYLQEMSLCQEETLLTKQVGLKLAK